ncbi:GGDEF domain-containing protein [Kineothrix sp. MB12-C1]|uniref:GGDEF domain-containing protein n=1 Tax=Kineothrix sp. MB12-C1 TaxID=3070215 RepID=UPI0027D24A1A|nr:hypothetical protein [Kineothrix sp. MB12-C1]WMC93723.1 hypothetical protein RBB56_05545 [Kineothrix sp. MB12-C1]
MNNRRHSILSDLSFQAVLILFFIAVLFISLDHVNLAANMIILCIVTILLLVTYFTSIKIGLILDIIFVFLLIALTVFETINKGNAIPANVYFWIFWPVATIVAISSYVRQHHLLDEENKELVRQIEKYVTIDELTQMNNLLGFERDASVYMNISRRYQMELELVLWRLTYQEDLNRLLGTTDMKKAIGQISDAIKNSLRKEDLVYIVDTEPYIWGTLLFSRPEAAEIVIAHVKEGVASAGLSELTKQKSFSLEISGTVVAYDGSMMTPLTFLNKAKKKLWLGEYQPEIWEEEPETEANNPNIEDRNGIQDKTIVETKSEIKEERKEVRRNEPRKSQPKNTTPSSKTNTTNNIHRHTPIDAFIDRLQKGRKRGNRTSSSRNTEQDTGVDKHGK